MNSSCITPPALVIVNSIAANTDELPRVREKIAVVSHESVRVGSRRYRKCDMRATHTPRRARIPLLRQVSPPPALSNYHHSHETNLYDETLLAMDATDETVALEPKAGVASQFTAPTDIVSTDKSATDYIPNHQEHVTLPLDLLVSFNELSALITNENQQQLESYCLPERLTFTADTYSEQVTYESNCINMSELKNKFDDNIVFIQKYGDDAYLIKTPSTNLWFKKTDAGSWKLSELLAV